MVHHKRTPSRWAAKASVGTNNTCDSEFAKSGIRRTYSQDTDLSETGKYSSSSSGDESWSETISLPGSPAAGKTKLSGQAEIFVPQQPMQSPGEHRTRLSSGASVFVPGQMTSSQMAPAFTPMPPTPADGYMPQMMPMDQANIMPNMSPMPYIMPDGCYYVAADGMCPVAMPVILGAAPLLPPSGVPEVPTEAKMEPELPMQPKKPVMMKDPQFTGVPKPAANASGKSRWADLDDDDDADDPWLR